MGVFFGKRKRFKMRVAFLVPAVMIFTFALAANVKKTSKGSPAKGPRQLPGSEIPGCAEKNTLYGGNVTKATKTKNASECASLCSRLPTKCRYWSYYQPCWNCQPTEYDDYTCLFKDSNVKKVPHVGWHSAKYGCEYDLRARDSSDASPKPSSVPNFFVAQTRVVFF